MPPAVGDDGRVNDLDRLERLLERRADLLDAATGLLLAAVRAGRSFTGREQDAWEYATGKAGDLGNEIGALAEDLRRRRYYPRRLPTAGR
jgi:hypothetical protein